MFGFIKKIGGKIGRAAKKVGGVAIKVGRIPAALATGGMTEIAFQTVGGFLSDRSEAKTEKTLIALQSAAGLDLSADVLGMEGILPWIRSERPPADNAGDGPARADWMNGAAIAINLYEPENAIGDYKMQTLAVFKQYVQAWENANAGAGAGSPSRLIDATGKGGGNRTTSFAVHLQKIGANGLREMDARLFGRELPPFSPQAASVTGQSTDGQVPDAQGLLDQAQRALDAFNRGRAGQPIGVRELAPLARAKIGEMSPVMIAMIVGGIILLIIVMRK